MKKTLLISLVVIFALSMAVTNAMAATTISTNISTGGTLAVTGASTLTGNVTAAGTLAVTGASTLTGNVTAAGTLAVTGATTQTGLLTTTAGITSGSNINSDTDSTDSLGITGTRWASTFSDNFTGNTITLDGTTGVNTLTVTDNVADALSIVDASGDLVVFTTTTGSEVMAVTPNSTFAGTLAVTGASTLTGNVTAAGTLAVTGATTQTGLLTTTAGITSGSNINSDTDSTDSLGITGTRWASTFSDNFTGNTITLDGATTVNVLTVTDNVADALSIVDGDSDLIVFDTRTGAEVVTITPNTAITGTLAVTGATTFTGAVTANGGITLGAGDDLIGSATSDITINTDKFTVAGDTGNTVIGGTLGITAGSATLTVGDVILTDGRLVMGTETGGTCSSGLVIDLATAAKGILTTIGETDTACAISFTNGTAGEFVVLSHDYTGTGVVTFADVTGFDASFTPVTSLCTGVDVGVTAANNDHFYLSGVMTSATEIMILGCTYFDAV